MANIPKFKLSRFESGLYTVKMRAFTGEGKYEGCWNNVF